MANRETAKAAIISKNVPSVTNAILTDMLNNYFADNVRFREDSATAQSSSVSSITVNFTGKDRVDLTRTGGALNISVSGMGDGEEKCLLITKTAGQEVVFTGVTDVTSIKEYVTAASVVLYDVVRKGSYYFARAWVDGVKQATDTIVGVASIASAAEVAALSNVNKIVVPGRLPIATTAQQGLIRKATQAEAEAGSSDVGALTPLQGNNFLNGILSGNVMNLSGKAGQITVQEYAAYKLGRFITGYFIAKSTSSGNFQVGTLSNWIPTHGGNWTFPGTPAAAGFNENGYAYVTQGSNIFMNVNNDNEWYVFTFTIPVAKLPL